MRKLTALLLALTMVFALAACGNDASPESSTPATTAPTSAPTPTPEPEADPVEIIVFAAASMQKALTDIAAAYKDTAPNVTLTFTFDSSGTLKTQIEEGADCDVFISAGQKQMNQLDITADASVNTDRQDFVLSDTRFNLLENQVVLVVPADNPAGIESFDDLSTDKLTLMAIGNSDVPVGQYAAEILTYMGIYDALNDAGKITFGSNTTEVTTQISEKVVDCGIVYRTDVASAADPSSLEIIAAAPEGSVSRAIYPAAILNKSDNVEAAQAFLDFLKGDTATGILEGYGFTVNFN